MLADLTAGAVEDAEARAARRPLADVERDALAQAPALDALAALAPAERVKIIAEVKRASPSRGDLADIRDPALQAARYEEGGASAISVLTEGRRFKGSLADLEAVKAQVSLPVLRKDFVATPYQVLEARASGADLVLLIVAALEQPLLQQLHDLGEFPEGAVKIAESAVMAPADVAHYRAAGADVVLVGEALVTNDPVSTLHAFLTAGDVPVGELAAGELAAEDVTAEEGASR